MLKKGSLIWPVNEPEAEIILIGGGHFKHSLLTLGEYAIADLFSVRRGKPLIKLFATKHLLIGANLLLFRASRFPRPSVNQKLRQ